MSTGLGDGSTHGFSIEGGFNFDVRKLEAGVEKARKSLQSLRDDLSGMGKFDLGGVGRNAGKSIDNATARTARLATALKDAFSAGGAAASRFGSGARQSIQGVISLADKLKMAAAGMAAALAGISAAGMKVGSSYEQAMARVKAISRATTDEFSALNAEAKRLGVVTVYSAKEAAEGMSHLAEGGLNATKIIQAMPHALDLAAVGQIAVADASKTLIHVMEGMQLSMEQLPHTVDVLAKAFTMGGNDMEGFAEAMKFVAPVAHAAGQSLESVAAEIQLLGKAGIDASMGGTALRGMFAYLSIEGPKVKRDFSDIGVAIYDTTGKLRPLADIIDDFNAASVRLGTGNENVKKIMQDIGQRAGPAMLNLLERGGEQIRKATDELVHSAGAAAEVAAIQQNTFGNRFKMVISTIQGFGITMNEVAGGPLKNMLVSLNDWLAAHKDVIDGGIKKAWDGISGAVSAVADAGKRMWEDWGPTLSNFYGGIQQIYQSVMSWFSALPPAQQDLLNVGLALTAVGGGLRAIGGSLPIVGQFVTAIGGLVNPVNLVSAAMKILVPLIGGGAGAATGLGGAILSVIAAGGPIALFLTGAVGITAIVAAMDGSSDLMGALKGLGSFLKDELTLGFNAATEGVQAFVAYLKGDAIEAVGHFHEMLSKLAEAVGMNGLAKDLHNLSESEMRTAKVTEARKTELAKQYGSKAHAETIMKAEGTAQKVQDARLAAKAAADEVDRQKGLQRNGYATQQHVNAAQSKYNAAARAREQAEAEHAQAQSAAQAIRDIYDQPGGPSVSQVIEDVRSDKVTDKAELARRLGSGKAAKLFEEHTAASGKAKQLGSRVNDLRDELEIANDRATEAAKAAKSAKGTKGQAAAEERANVAKAEATRISNAVNTTLKEYNQAAKDTIKLTGELQRAVQEARTGNPAEEVSKSEVLIDPSKIDWTKGRNKGQRDLDEILRQEDAKAAKEAGATQGQGPGAKAGAEPIKVEMTDAAAKEAGAAQAQGAADWQRSNPDAQAQANAAVRQQEAAGTELGPQAGNPLSAQDEFAAFEEGLAGKSTGGTTKVSRARQRAGGLSNIRKQGASAMQSMRQSAVGGGIDASEQQGIQFVSNLFQQAEQTMQQAMKAEGDEQQQLLEASQKQLQAAQNAQKAFEAGTRGVENLGKAAGMTADDMKKLDEAEQEKTANAKGQLTPAQQAMQQGIQQAQQQFQQQAQQLVGQAMQQVPDQAAAAATAPWAQQGQGMSDLQQAISHAKTAGNPVKAFQLLGSLVDAKIRQLVGNVHAAQYTSFGDTFGPNADNTYSILHGQSAAAATYQQLTAALAAINAKINALIAGKKHFAAGGVVSGPTDAYLGENGPEAVIPLWQLASGMSSGLLGMFGGQSGLITGLANNLLNASLYQRANPAYGMFGSIGQSLLGGGAIGNISKMFSSDQSWILNGLGSGASSAFQLDQLANLQESLANGITNYRNSQQLYLGPGAPTAWGNPGYGRTGGPYQPGGAGVSAANPGGGMSMGDMHVHVNGADLTTETQRRAVAESLVDHLDAAVKRRGYDRSGASALRTPYHIGARPPGVTSGMPQ